MRKGARKAVGKTPLIALRLDKGLTARLDAWAARKGVSRSEAIRIMIGAGLMSSSRLAGQQIDRLSDPGASGREKASRKRRLLKGPEEFRALRDVRRKQNRER